MNYCKIKNEEDKRLNRCFDRSPRKVGDQHTNDNPDTYLSRQLA